MLTWRVMKLTSYLALTGVLAACAADTQTQPEASEAAPAATGFVHRAGADVIGNDGAVVTLEGVDLGGWLIWEGWLLGGEITLNQLDNADRHVYSALTSVVGSSATNAFQEAFRDAYVTEADIAHIAALGMNSVRVPFDSTLLASDDHPYTYLATGWKRLDDIVAWGSAHHVYVILDMHSVPGGQCNLFVDDPGPTEVWASASEQTRTVQMWRAIAARYATQRWIAGYDLMNEPCGVADSQLEALDARIVAAIREVDPNHMVVVEGNDNATTFTAFPQLLDPNELYSAHIYTTSAATRAADLSSWTAFVRAQDAPLWIGEFGESSASTIAATVQAFVDPQYQVNGWALWTYKRAPDANPTVETVTIPAAWRTTMLWVTAPLTHARPTAAQVSTGMSQYLAAVPTSRCSEDDGLVEIITP